MHYLKLKLEDHETKQLLTWTKKKEANKLLKNIEVIIGQPVIKNIHDMEISENKNAKELEEATEIHVHIYLILAVYSIPLKTIKVIDAEIKYSMLELLNNDRDEKIFEAARNGLVAPTKNEVLTKNEVVVVANEIASQNEFTWRNILEEYFVNYLANTNSNVEQSKVIYQFHIKKYRIDAQITLNNKHYLLEYDENEHKRYDLFNEIKRYKAILEYYKDKFMKLQEASEGIRIQNVLNIVRFSDSHIYTMEDMINIFNYVDELKDSQYNVIYVKYSKPLEIQEIYNDFSTYQF